VRTEWYLPLRAGVIALWILSRYTPH